MTENDDIAREEKELLEKLAAIRKKKEDIRKKEYAHSMALVEDTRWDASKKQRELDKLPLHLTMMDFHPKYQDVMVMASKVDTDFFETFKYSKSSYERQNKFTFRIDQWTNQVKDYCAEHDIKVKWATEEVRDKYLAYKAIPRMIISLDEQKNRVVLLTRFGDEILPRRFYARQLHENIGDKDIQKPFWLPISELANVYTELVNEDGVEWGETALARAKKELNLLAELDEIALAKYVALTVPFVEEAVTFQGDKFELRPFQRKGVKWMQTAGYNVLLADQMGLGKTAQAIALFLLLELELENLEINQLTEEKPKLLITGRKEDAA